MGPNCLESELVQPAFCTEVNALEGCEELDFAASNLPKTPGGMWSRLVFHVSFLNGNLGDDVFDLLRVVGTGN